MNAIKNPAPCCSDCAKKSGAPAPTVRRNPVSVVGGGASVGPGGSSGSGVSPSSNQFTFRTWNWPAWYYPASYYYYPYVWPYPYAYAAPYAYAGWAGWPAYAGWTWPYSPYTAYVPRAPVAAAA